MKEGDGQRSLRKVFEQEVPEEDAETWDQHESTMKKLKATNENDFKTSPASSCFRSLKHDATEAVVDKHDIEMEVTLAVKLVQRDMKWNRNVETRFVRDRSSNMRE